MPIYHFVSNDGPDPIVVERELSCAREAKYEAVEYLWEALRDVRSEFWTQQMLTIFVTDAWHVKLFTLTLTLADGPDGQLRVVK